MSGYYDRKGNPIGMMQWANAMEKDKRVALTELGDDIRVSTVWLGLDHRHGPGAPLIFETMVFKGKDSYEDVDADRYSTEEEALAGHKAMVEKWRGKAQSKGGFSFL